MKKRVLLLSLAALGLTSCWQAQTPRTFVRPVKLSEAVSLSSYDKDFVGVVSAEQYTNLAFRVSGQVTKTFVTEGAQVKKGQLLAQLDPGDFRLQLEADKAQYTTSQSILERNKRLLAKQAISQQDYEIAQSNFLKAKSAYEYSLNQLEYTRLKAPFSGSIEKKFVEDYQKVQTGESIFKLINPDLLEVNFTLPESDVDLIRVNKNIFIEFDNYRGEYFRAEIKDVVDASVDGAGIPVTLRIVDKTFDPNKYNIKAGFACRVKIQIERNREFHAYVTVPITAIFNPPTDKSGTYVWVYEPDSSQVNIRQVKTQGLVGGDRVIVPEGLAAGEQVVTAGVYQLTEGQKVNVLK